ncbi:MAG: FAD-dependent hydroxylase [Cyanobacteria bacterium P01_D01_bin.14]
MSGFTYDLIIVGGGIPGLTLACGLRESGLRVAVLEAQSEQAVRERSRAYALSPLSAKIFQSVGVWNAIAPAITHFSKVVLSDADYPHRVAFPPADIGEPAVYYCAEHRVLLRALQQQVATDPGITCYYKTQVREVVYDESRATVEVETAQGPHALGASLVVAADGMRSKVRQGAGIKTDGWNYWQSCITAFVSPTQPHQNIAHERFWPSGPFAILPLPQNRCQIVWVAPHREAAAIAALPPDQFIAAMQHRYGDHSGSLRLLSEPLVFPARLMHSRRYCQPRLALLGDAAHNAHPVGGQGLNLGIRDAATLAQVLLTAKQQDLGDIRVLRRYGRRRRLENGVMLLFTDILNRTFSNCWLPMRVLRRWVLRLMIGWSPLRRLMLHLMAGLWGTQLSKLLNPRVNEVAMTPPTHPQLVAQIQSPEPRGGKTI